MFIFANYKNRSVLQSIMGYLVLYREEDMLILIKDIVVLACVS